MSDDRLKAALDDMFTPEKRPIEALGRVAAALSLLLHAVNVLAEGERPDRGDLEQVRELIQEIIELRNRG